RPETLEAMLAARRDGAGVVVLGFEAAEPGGYGRLVTGADGGLEAIVEARDATPGERAIRLCNSGGNAAEAGLLFELLREGGTDTAKGGYYRTDVVGLARARGLSARVITCPEAETLGVSSRADLAAAGAVFQDRARRAAMEAGATLVDPGSTWLALDTALGRDVVVEPQVFFGPGVTVGDGSIIHSFSHLERCKLGPGVEVGPFARLRPGADVGADARIGNFVEVKNATLQRGVKVNHLSYIGDASIGESTNVGAGTITCNYDGV